MSVYKSDIERGIPEYVNLVFSKEIKVGDRKIHIVGAVTEYLSGPIESKFGASVTLETEADNSQVCSRSGIILAGKSFPTLKEAHNYCLKYL